MKIDQTKTNHFIIGVRSVSLSIIAFFLMIGQIAASSHREAPLISNDPLADNTDLYAFRSPDNPDMITIIACYIPAEMLKTFTLASSNITNFLSLFLFFLNSV